MKAFHRILLFLCLAPSISRAQDFNRYQPVQAVNPVPADFIRGSIEKFEAGKAELEDQRGWEKKVREKFLLANNYQINQLLASGRVLFNDPITNYITEVKDKILEGDPDLAKQIRVYAVRSSDVNAFATNDGIVLVTMGLLAQLENEAQLAFILSHEVVHYVKKHNINSYVESQQIARGKEIYQGLSFRDRILASHHYSRDLEMESDRVGLETYYSSSKYTYDAIEQVFDILQFSHLPFDDDPFRYEVLENDHLKIPDSYKLKKIPEITYDEDGDDSMSTHPNVNKRKEYTSRILVNTDNTGREDFLVSRERFETIRKMSRFELVRVHLLDLDYPEVLYLSSLLLKDDPGNYYLRRSIASALYSMSKMKSGAVSTVDIVDAKNVEGNSLPAFNLLKKLNGEQLTILALSHNWKLHQEFPEEEYFKMVTEDLFRELVFTHQIKFDEFYNQPRHVVLASLGVNVDSLKVNEDEVPEKKVGLFGDSDEDEEDDEEEAVEVAVHSDENDSKTKIEKIKEKKALSKITNPKSFVYFAFVDEMKQAAFTKRFNYWLDEYAREQELEASKTFDQKRKESKQKEKDEKLLKKKGYHLGLDTLLVMEPLYLRVDQNAKESVKYLSSESNQQFLTGAIVQYAAEQDLKTTLFNMKALGINDADVFNETALLKEWTRERMAFEEVPLISSQFEGVAALGEKYGSEHLLVPGVLSRKTKKDFAQAFYNCSCYSSTIILLPLGIYELFKQSYITEYYYLIFNTKDGELVLPGYVRSKAKDETGVVRKKFRSAIEQAKRVKTEK